ncbi:hypothetical protein [Corynebacterium auriscanis]|uniref:hypothetical protein n=1 Tax=Corynebacterium auriscanis TaxID=99807 RepID=UPI003CEA9B92
MSPDKPNKILTSEETYDAVIDWFRAEDDWVNLVYVVNDVGYDDETLTREQLQDVMDKVLAHKDLQLLEATGSYTSDLTQEFGGYPLPHDVDTARLSDYIFQKDKSGYLMGIMVAPYPDIHKMPYEYEETPG